MQSFKPSFVARTVFGLALLVLLIWYVDAASIVDTFANLRPAWVVGAALLIVCAALIAAFNRHLFIDLEDKIPYVVFLPMYWVAWAMGLVIPGQVGDVATLSAILRRKGMQWPESLGRSLLDKLISFVLMFSLGVTGVLLVAIPEVPSAGTIALLAAGTTLLAIVAVILFWQRRRISIFFSRENSALARAIGDTVHEFLDTFARHPRKVLLNAVLTLVCIGLIGMAYWCMFFSLGYTQLPPGKLILLVAACSIVAYIPISFNGIGTVEVTGIALFGQLEVPAAAVLSAYLCLRLIVMTLAWLPAATILAFRSPVNSPEGEHKSR